MLLVFTVRRGRGWADVINASLWGTWLVLLESGLLLLQAILWKFGVLSLEHSLWRRWLGCFNFYCSATRIPLFIITFLLATLFYLLLDIAWIIVLPAIGHLLLMTSLWNCDVENFISSFCQLSAVVWWCHRLIKVISLQWSPRFSPSLQIVNVQWPDNVTLAFLPSSMRVGRLTARTGLIQLS